MVWCQRFGVNWEDAIESVLSTNCLLAHLSTSLPSSISLLLNLLLPSFLPPSLPPSLLLPSLPPPPFSPSLLLSSLPPSLFVSAKCVILICNFYYFIQTTGSAGVRDGETFGGEHVCHTGDTCQQRGPVSLSTTECGMLLTIYMTMFGQDELTKLAPCIHVHHHVQSHDLRLLITRKVNMCEQLVSH